MIKNSKRMYFQKKKKIKEGFIYPYQVCVEMLQSKTVSKYYIFNSIIYPVYNPNIKRKSSCLSNNHIISKTSKGIK